jgi:hypothetical protein
MDMEQASQTASAGIVAVTAGNLWRIINQLQRYAYRQKAPAPAIIERASAAAYILPSATIVSPNVANEIEGAAPNKPAKLFGFRTSASAANDETTRPPITNRRIKSLMVSPAPNTLQHSLRFSVWNASKIACQIIFSVKIASLTLDMFGFPTPLE